MTNDEPGFSTLSIHAGARPDPTTGARITPIYQTTAFVFDDVDHAASLFGLQAFGNIYTRITNPTTAALEERVAALEGAPAALAVASGHAAQAIVFHSLMQPGDEFVASTKLYGGSINQFNHAFKNFGWVVKWADPDDLDAVKAAVNEKTKAIFIESIANPGGVVTDIEGVAAIAKAAKIPLIVDNTLATPYLIRPLDHGADIIVHSATKYLVRPRQFDGRRHRRLRLVRMDGRRALSHAVGAAARIQRHDARRDLRQFRFRHCCRVLGLRDLGPAISPFNSFLILTGIETLSLRMQRHCDNALAVAKHLAGHDKVGWVSYAGLPGNRYNELAKRYCPKGAGGVFTFGVKGGYEAGVALVRKLQLFSHVANIGDTRSLVIHPASTTHRQLADAQKIAAGAGPDVVRLSIGLEDVADLIADLDQALA